MVAPGLDHGEEMMNVRVKCHERIFAFAPLKSQLDTEEPDLT